MTNAAVIPVIDPGPYLAGVPRAVDRAAEGLRFALTEIGFYLIVNHGVPSEQIQAVFRQAARFHAQALGKKVRSSSTSTMSATCRCGATPCAPPP
jgi:isopenicillin N synthase-like dioxygenase